jgi:hypothetical protein
MSFSPNRMDRVPPHENISSFGKRAPKAKGGKKGEAVLPFDGGVDVRDEDE